jgi:hypothetical protein
MFNVTGDTFPFCRRYRKRRRQDGKQDKTAHGKDSAVVPAIVARVRSAGNSGFPERLGIYPPPILKRHEILVFHLIEAIGAPLEHPLLVICGCLF